MRRRLLGRWSVLRTRGRWGRAGLVCAWALVLVGLCYAWLWGAWNTSSPAGTTPVSLVDDIIRADKSTLLSALMVEHRFTALDTSGYHQEGSARVYVWGDSGEETGDSPVGLRDPWKLGTQDATGRVLYARNYGRWWIGKASSPYWEEAHARLPAGRDAYAPASANEEWTLTSTSWADVAGGADDLSVTLTTTTYARLDISAALNARVETDDVGLFLRLVIDGTPATSGENGQAHIAYIPGATVEGERWRTANLGFLTDELAPGDHTVKLQYKLSGSGTAKLNRGMQNLLVVRAI